MATRIQIRRDTAANWTAANPTLAQGEIGYETDTGKAKVGDGSTPWTTRGYWPSLLSNPSIDYPLIKSAEEVVTVSATAANGTVNFDALTQGVLYYTTNASGNFTLNFRGNASTTLNSLLPVGGSISLVFMNTNGGTAYYASAFQIDGNSVTPKWSGASNPTAGFSNSIDTYSFTIIKTAATPTYTVLAGGPVKFA